jgi:hypothetical protein
MHLIVHRKSFADFALISPLNFYKKTEIIYGESDKDASSK